MLAVRYVFQSALFCRSAKARDFHQLALEAFEGTDVADGRGLGLDAENGGAVAVAQSVEMAEDEDLAVGGGKRTQRGPKELVAFVAVDARSGRRDVGGKQPPVEPADVGLVRRVGDRHFAVGIACVGPQVLSFKVGQRLEQERPQFEVDGYVWMRREVGEPLRTRFIGGGKNIFRRKSLQQNWLQIPLGERKKPRTVLRERRRKKAGCVGFVHCRLSQSPSLPIPSGVDKTPHFHRIPNDNVQHDEITDGDAIIRNSSANGLPSMGVVLQVAIDRVRFQPPRVLCRQTIGFRKNCLHWIDERLIGFKRKHDGRTVSVFREKHRARLNVGLDFNEFVP